MILGWELNLPSCKLGISVEEFPGIPRGKRDCFQLLRDDLLVPLNWFFSKRQGYFGITIVLSFQDGRRLPLLILCIPMYV